MQVTEASATLRVAQASRVLELTRPSAGAQESFDANEYSRIDFRSIIAQWQQLHSSGRSLVIVFTDGAVIEISNFFGGDGSAGGLIAQIDDATYVAPELFLLKYSTVGVATDPHSDDGHIPSGADFVDPPAALPLLGNETALDLLLPENTSLIPPSDVLEFQMPVSPLVLPALPALPIANQPAEITGDTSGITIEAGGVNNDIQSRHAYSDR
jgi:hypothetical protein